MNKTQNEIQIEERTWRLKFLNKASEIAKWNHETFPDATVSGQVLKLSEEFEEFKEAIENGTLSEMEKADCFIVAASLKERFDNELGFFVLYCLIDEMTDGGEQRASEYMKAIENKMEINKRRTAENRWKKLPDGRFKHEGEECEHTPAVIEIEHRGTIE